MFCQKCGFMLSAFDAECPRCAKMGDPQNQVITPAAQNSVVTPAPPAGQPAPPPSINPPNTNPPPQKWSFSIVNSCGGCLLVVIAIFFIATLFSPVGYLAIASLVWCSPVFATDLWVYFDASTIGVQKGQMPGVFDMGAGEWAFACLLLWIVAFPAYLAKRGEYKRINGK